MSALEGRVLKVNLAQGTTETEKISGDYFKKYGGGYGLGAALMLERMDPKTDPLGEGNILGFSAGYLTGTGSYIASRFMVFGKSPSTGGWGDSNCGGKFGPKLRAAGFDTLLFYGKSDAPVYLFIENGRVEILKAGDLWGKDTYLTEDELKKRHGSDCEAACIGPAGEILTVIAGISTDKGRFAARSGLGAVMGSKNLKAVVVKGNLPIPCRDREELNRLKKKYKPVFGEGFGEILGKYGTPMFYHGSLASGDAPVKNWSSSVEELGEAPEDEAEIILRYQKKRYGCYGCPVACGGHVAVEDGPYKTKTTVHKVEYETMGMFGSNLLNKNLESLILINDLCNRYGMDTIGCGGLVGFAIEAFKQGIIATADTGGLVLEWGDPDSIILLVKQIGEGKGLGAVLREGFDHACSVFGDRAKDFVMAVRNEALPAHDPRWSSDLALTYYSDATPARHTQGCTTFPAAGYEMPEQAEKDPEIQAKAHKDNVNLYHALSSLGLCLFGFSILDYRAIPEFLRAVDGEPWQEKDLFDMGERIHRARHSFNLKAGIRFTEYSFPARVLGTPPLQTGATKGATVDLPGMVREYLASYKFDPATLEGCPEGC